MSVEAVQVQAQAQVQVQVVWVCYIIRLITQTHGSRIQSQKKEDNEGV